MPGGSPRNETRDTERNGMPASQRKLAIVGAVGVPGKYGGFESLVENLVRWNQRRPAATVSVFCSGVAYTQEERVPEWRGARLFYIPLSANGVSSVAYDIWAMARCIGRGFDTILVLGVSGGVFFPILKRLFRGRVVVNIDGIEWRRAKWGPVARWFLRLSERLAVRYSDVVIADNAAVAEHVIREYGRSVEVIAYGGDHVLAAEPAALEGLPKSPYMATVCRIEPENNVAMILEAFSQQDSYHLVMVGNWEQSAFGRELRSKYGRARSLTLLDPIYHLGKLRTLRERAAAYVHGHSAGGTNPSLVEAMFFGKPVLAYDCVFNRYTTEGKALYFKDASGLLELIKGLDAGTGQAVGDAMGEVAARRYRWDVIARQYFSVLTG